VANHLGIACPLLVRIPDTGGHPFVRLFAFAIPPRSVRGARVTLTSNARKLLKEFREFFLFSPEYICRVASARRTAKNSPSNRPGEFNRTRVNPDHDFCPAVRKH